MSVEISCARCRLFEDLPPPEAERVADMLAASTFVEVEAGLPYFRASFRSAALLVVDQGFVVVRATFPGLARSMITCEAGAGRILLPPGPDEVVVGLGKARVTRVSAEDRDRLLALPAVAQRVVEQMALTLGQKQEAIAIFAQTRHLERVRLKLLQLARGYGRVVRDGIRIDFPVSHTVLAEMIGSSRETVTRAIDTLQREGFVARRGHTYRLLVEPERVLGAGPP